MRSLPPPVRPPTLNDNRYPEEVIITDVVLPSSADGTSTPSGEPGDDFFSSWDKPTIKRPSNPPSRTQTPPVVSRTASPFLNPGANGSGPARPKSPLIESESSQAPAASRTISSSSIRKAATSGAPRKANVLGAKKTQKLGAKRVGGAESVDFEEAERKAKEEADRIAKLGYDPDAEAEAASGAKSANLTDKSKIASPTPLKPAQAGYGASGAKERSSSDVERLGMGLGRLGFGQTGGAKPAASAPKKMGFGAVGNSRAVDEGKHFSRISHSPARLMFFIDDDERYARTKFGAQKSISSDEFFGKGAFDPSAQSEAKSRLQGFEGASAISSNAYFGRPEDDIPQADEYGNYGDLEGAARDFVRKFGVTAGDDLDTLTAVLGEGATKLQGKWTDVFDKPAFRHYFEIALSENDKKLTRKFLTGAIRSYLAS